MNSLLKRAAVVVAGGALAFSGLAFASAAPAAAATSPIDVTSIRVASSSGPYMSYSTKYMQTATDMRQVGSLGQYGRVTVYGDIYRGSTRLLANQQLAYVSNTYQSTTSGFTFKNGWGRGAFRVANVRVQWNDGNNNIRWFTDASVAGRGFTIKSAIEGNLKYRNVISIKSTGSKKKVKVGVRYYSPTGWKPYRGKKVVVQVKKGKWKKKKALRLNRKGKAGFTFYSSKRAKYRVKIPATKTVQGGYSRGTIKL